MKAGGIIIFVTFWILLVAFLAWQNPVTPNIYNDEPIDPCRTGGHPLWTDC